MRDREREREKEREGEREREKGERERETVRESTFIIILKGTASIEKIKIEIFSPRCAVQTDKSFFLQIAFKRCFI